MRFLVSTLYVLVAMMVARNAWVGFYLRGKR